MALWRHAGRTLEEEQRDGGIAPDLIEIAWRDERAPAALARASSPASSASSLPVRKASTRLVKATAPAGNASSAEASAETVSPTSTEKAPEGVGTLGSAAHRTGPNLALTPSWSEPLVSKNPFHLGEDLHDRAAPAAPESESLALEEKHHGFSTHVAEDGTLTFEDHPPADLTELVMRVHGIDPYGSDKLGVAARTRPLRDRMNDRARSQGKLFAIADGTSRLERVWADQALSPAARRRVLFQLWDECLENDEARPVRQAVIDFVRRVLPRGTPDGYTEDELATLNRGRSSRQVFAPYLSP